MRAAPSKPTCSPTQHMSGTAHTSTMRYRRHKLADALRTWLLCIAGLRVHCTTGMHAAVADSIVRKKRLMQPSAQGQLTFRSTETRITFRHSGLWRQSATRTRSLIDLSSLHDTHQAAAVRKRRGTGSYFGRAAFDLTQLIRCSLQLVQDLDGRPCLGAITSLFAFEPRGNAASTIRPARPLTDLQMGLPRAVN
jgi:hypothetical protein